MWEPRCLTTLWASTVFERDSLARKSDNLTATCEPIVYKMLEPRCLPTLWASTVFEMDSFSRKSDNLTAICEQIVQTK
jgi:hypothetical protein